MKRATRITNIVTDILDGHLPGWLIVVLMFMVLTEVIARYIFNSPLRVADEIGAYLLVAIVFLGLGYTWKERAHIRIEFAINMLPPKIRAWLNLMTLLLAVAFIPLLIYASYDFLQTTVQTGIRGYGWMRIPLIYPRTLLLVGTIFLIFPIIIDLIEAIRTFKTPGVKTQ